MKVLIVNPPAYNNTDFIREGRCMQTKSSWAALWMPLSLCYIAAVLRKDNHTIKLFDCIAEKADTNKLIEDLLEYKPEMVILNTAIPSITGDMNTAAEIKKVIPEVKITVVGMYPTLFEKESLERFPQIDFAIMDEPEWISASLLRSVAEKSSFSGIKGLIYRNGPEIKINERQNLSENRLDDLPLPARDLLNNDAYRLPTNGEKFTLLSVGRGCSEKCIYCIANLYYGKRFRIRSVENVIAEIEECINKYDIHSFLFWGESFTTDPGYGENICDEITRKNIKISWSTTTRVDTLNSVLLEKMKNAGCILLGLGIESYDQAVLNSIGKRITVEQIDKAVSMVKKAGIKSIGHFVFGLPGDTREAARKTIAFACKNVDFAQFYCAVPYPKTELGRIAVEKGWTCKYDYEDLDFTQAVMGNESMTAGEIKKIRDYAYRRFYFRPRMVLQTLHEVKSIKSFFSILNFMNWITTVEKKS
jgi:anaerobic magnesium-protoporphyrin IX monomethyl ester cyclase